jgi:3'-phosphoadenosine 5'-phosphosulfate sulfotransferase (PAPS reductase)/FAD synthetase
MFSGGVGSWAAAKRVAARNGVDNLTLLFTDTKSEDADTYRFLREAAANVGAPLVTIADGRTIWDVFREERFLGNTRVDLCSRILKRELADRWLAEHYQPASTTVYVGIDWSEEHRFTRLAQRKLPWRYEAPLCDAPYLTKGALHEWATREGLQMQRLYRLGMPHANCGGGCVKAGAGHFARLLAADPERFAEWERNEASLRAELGDVAILRDRTGGETRPLPLSELRQRIEAGQQPDMFDIGGCGCFVDAPEELAGIAPGTSGGDTDA